MTSKHGMETLLQKVHIIISIHDGDKIMMTTATRVANPEDSGVFFCLFVVVCFFVFLGRGSNNMWSNATNIL